MKIWDTRTGICLQVLEGHKAEISSAQFEFSGDFVATGSIDRTCIIWDVNTGKLHLNDRLNLQITCRSSR